MPTHAAPKSPVVQVVAAVIERHGKLLLCQRPMDKHHGGLWEFPGGKLAAGESANDALVRELDEELGVAQAEPGVLLYRDEAALTGHHVDIDFIQARLPSDPRCLEHADMRWVSLEDALELPLAPADRRFVEHLLRQRSALSEKSVFRERALGGHDAARIRIRLAPWLEWR